MSTVKKAACQAFMYLVELVVILLSVLLERLAVRFVRWAGKRSMRVRL